MNTTHTCSYHCERPECVRAQRDELRERLAREEQEFIKHEGGEDGWSDWVCPDRKSYLMKCCDCGLVHEAQFGVVRYKSEAEREDCDRVDDPNLQAVFRMRRSEEWTPEDTAYRPGGLPARQEQEPVAWMREGWGPDCGPYVEFYRDDEMGWRDRKEWTPLYTAPQREWVGLTEEEIEDLYFDGWSMSQLLGFARAIEAKLREKNA